MRVNQILDHITEAKFDTVLTDITPWHRKAGEKDIYLRTGWIGDFQIVVSIKYSNVVVLNIRAAAVEFGIRSREMAARDDDFEYELGKLPEAPTAQVFGAVVNVLRGNLPLPWDFIYATTKDSVTERIRLYTALFNRFAPSYGMVVDSVRNAYEGGVIMARHPDLAEVKRLVVTHMFSS
jgi:hypothetical protein